MDKLLIVSMVSMFLVVSSYMCFLLYLGYQQEKNTRKRKTVTSELVAALEAWQLMDNENADKLPCPDYIMRKQYQKKARKLTITALALVKE